MSLIPVTLNNATDTYTNQPRATTNYANGTLLRTKSGSPNVQYGYVFFSRPFPLGATIVSAHLLLNQANTVTGSNTVTVRRTNQSWKVARLIWNNQPTVNTSNVPLTKSAPTAGTVWDFDVTAEIQAISDGAAWYGFRVESNNATAGGLNFRSSQALTNKPSMVVTWTDAPDAPSVLSPAGGRAVTPVRPIMRFDFTDVVGNTALNAVQVQMNATSDFTAPNFDSGAQLTSVPQLDMTQSFPRSVSVTTTSGSTTITAAAGTFEVADAPPGASTITGTGIPASATIATVAAGGASATLSAAATATGTITATITRTMSALTDGQIVYWRVRVQDGAGVWSPYSLVASFTRQSRGVLTPASPSSGSPYVTEPTPPITWTFTGRTQSAYQVIIEDLTGKQLHTSGKVTSTGTGYTLPAKIINDSVTYNLRLRVWDTIDRENTPNDPVYLETTQQFTYTYSATVSPVTALTGTDLTPVPGLQLDWTRSTAPDSYTIARDGRTIVANLLPTDSLVSGTAYRYVDRNADPRVSHVWTVRAVVNGITSSSNPTVTKTLTPVGIWLTDPDSSDAVQLLGDDSGTWESGEEGEVYTPLNGTRVVRITQALRGYSGAISGDLISFNGSSVAAQKAIVAKWQQNPAMVLSMTLADMSISVILGHLLLTPTPDAELRYTLSAEFWQTDSTLRLT